MSDSLPHDGPLGDYLVACLDLYRARLRARREAQRAKQEGPEPHSFGLFCHMSDEHGLTLLDSELHEIERLVAQDAQKERDAAEGVIRQMRTCLGHVASILADKRASGAEISAGNTAFISMERWTNEALELSKYV